MNLWDWKARFYDESRRIFPFNLILAKEVRNLKELLSQVNRDKEWVLDLGTGPGFVLRRLHNGSNTVGLDKSIGMIAKAKKARLNRVVVADANRLPFKPNTFGLVTAIGVFEYQESQTTFLAESRCVLKSHGRMVLTFAQPGLLNILRFLLAQRLYLTTSKRLNQLLNCAGYSIGAMKKSLIQRQVLLHPNSQPS